MRNPAAHALRISLRRAELGPPFFFVFIGTQLELAELADAGTLALLAAVTAIAAATKYAGARIGARRLPATESHLVALGMIPRGEVGIIVAGIGTTTGVIEQQLFAVIVGMSILTTLAVPPLLRRTLTNDATPTATAG